MRRFNSSHVAVALASLLCITAYSLSLLLHPAQAQASEEEEPVMHVLQGVHADEPEPLEEIFEGQEWRYACSREDVRAVHDYFNPIARRTIVSSCNPPRLALNMPSLQYPKLAQAARVSGKVVVQILVDEKGRVIYSDALSGHPLLTPAAVKAACQVRFEPVTFSGIPYQTSGTLTYNFVLE